MNLIVFADKKDFVKYLYIIYQDWHLLLLGVSTFSILSSSSSDSSRWIIILKLGIWYTPLGMQRVTKRQNNSNNAVLLEVYKQWYLQWQEEVI